MAELEPGSAEWWVAYLEKGLDARREGLELWERYYDGRHPLPFITKAHGAKMHDEFRRLLDESRSNFCRLVVDAVEERLSVEGIRLSARSDAQTDQTSWEIWQANQMDSESGAAVLDALVKGISYLSVWEGERPDDYPTIAVEDPCQTIVAYTPGTNYRRRDAALKIWLDDRAGMERANLYLPDAIYKFQARKKTDGGGTAYQQNLSESVARFRWEPLPNPDDARVANPIGVVPIVPLRNRPRIRREGESELADVYRVQNQINGFLFLLALAGYFGAHRQRWAAGIPIMRDDAGNPVEPFDTGIDKLWQAENADVKFGEFSQTDLDGYIRAIEQKVLHIAVTTRTPRHYLIEQGQSPSGDAIESAESGLVKKAERKQRPFGEGFEEALLLARRFQGETDVPVDSEIVWSDAATPTIAQTTDAVLKQYQAGIIDQETALEKLGYSQTQIARIVANGAVAELFRAATEPATVPQPEQPVVPA